LHQGGRAEPVHRQPVRRLRPAIRVQADAGSQQRARHPDTSQGCRPHRRDRTADHRQLGRKVCQAQTVAVPRIDLRHRTGQARTPQAGRPVELTGSHLPRPPHHRHAQRQHHRRCRSRQGHSQRPGRRPRTSRSQTEIRSHRVPGARRSRRVPADPGAGAGRGIAGITHPPAWLPARLPATSLIIAAQRRPCR